MYLLNADYPTRLANLCGELGKHLVHVVHNTGSTLLSMKCGEGSIRVIAGAGSFQSQPFHPACQHGTFRHAMAQCLERTERPPKLLTD